jgi:hypothetical protein
MGLVMENRILQLLTSRPISNCQWRRFFYDDTHYYWEYTLIDGVLSLSCRRAALGRPGRDGRRATL